MDIVVAQRPPILKLLPRKDQALLVWWDAFLILDLCFYVVDRVAGLDFEGDSLARESFDEAFGRGKKSVSKPFGGCKGY